MKGKPLGPLHFTPYEMLQDPTTADAHAADVYSLAKSLWVLASGQNYPPPGHQPAGSKGFDIADAWPHPRAAALDQEVDLMTRLRPHERPTKEQVARDLAKWHELAKTPFLVDVADARTRLRSRLSAEIVHQDTAEEQRELAYAAARRFQELTRPLNEALKQLWSRTRVDRQDDKITVNTVRARVWGGQVIFRWQRCTLVNPLDRPASPTLRMSRSLELVDDGTLLLNLLVLVGLEGVMHTDFSWQSEVMSAPIGTIEAEKMLDDGIKTLAEQLQRAIDVFVERFPEARGTPSS